MFPLVAIAAFFILGVAFFAFGKDDFGIKRLKEVSNDPLAKENDVVSHEQANQIEPSTEKNELVSSEASSEIDSNNNPDATDQNLT